MIIEIVGLKREPQTFTVKAVGFLGDNPLLPVISIEDNSSELPTFRRLHDSLAKWVNHIRLIEENGLEILPVEVEFGKKDGKYYAEIL